jgi:hypothetical protein
MYSKSMMWDGAQMPMLTQDRNIHLFICTYVDWIMMFSIQKPLVKVSWKYANTVHIGRTILSASKNTWRVFNCCHNVGCTNLVEGGCDPYVGTTHGVSTGDLLKMCTFNVLK